MAFRRDPQGPHFNPPNLFRANGTQRKTPGLGGTNALRTTRGKSTQVLSQLVNRLPTQSNVANTLRRFLGVRW